MRPLCRLFFVVALLSLPAVATAFDRARLPEALRNVPLDHLSSGALLRLDRDGDLVESVESWVARVKSLRATAAAPLVALDPRVASNIRLGDDPAPLPANMRAQAEPHIARSLTDADVLLATFQEGRFATGGGAVDCGYALSRDGGLTWTRSLIPNLTPASGGPYFRATDPVAAVAANGDLYLNTLGSTDAQFATGAVLVSRSTDGGSTFGAPVVVYQSPNSTQFPDKNWMAINTFPGTPAFGRIFVAFALFGGNSNVVPLVRTFSDNGGANWSAVGPVNPANSDSQGAQPVFLANGKLAVVYWNFNGTPGFGDDFMQVAISTDGGATFGAPKFINAVSIYSEPAIRNGVFLPAATTDRTTGNIYVVYQATFNGGPRIVFTKSTNSGDTWSAPVAISNNPNTAGVFNPTIAASDDGQTLTATFYDHRDNPGSNTLIDLYLAQSFDGGATWQPNIRLTSTSTDAAFAPLTSQGYMLGDYMGIAGAKNANVPAVPVWIDTRTGNPDPFIARVGIAPQFDFTSWQAGRLSLAQINSAQSGGPAGDADGDGEDNSSEFQHGTDPNNAASVVHTARQLNISTRTHIEGGDRVLIGGFIVTGTVPKQVIVRGLGPSLVAAGIPGAMPDPILELVPPSGPTITNDDWQDTDPAAVQATGIPPADSRESAIVATIPPGNYSAVLRSKNDAPGVGLVEVYDLNPTADSQFANLSSRGFVGNGDDVMIGGVIVGQGQGIGGAGSARTVVRGLGPSLAQIGVAGALQNPELLIFNANGDVIAFNNNWQDSQATEIQSLNLAPSDARESAIVLTLVRGNYTALVRGKDDTSGIALVETFNVP